jgi:hypothetical protein
MFWSNYKSQDMSAFDASLAMNLDLICHDGQRH